MKEFYKISIKPSFDIDYVLCPISVSLWNITSERRRVKRLSVFGIRILEWETK